MDMDLEQKAIMRLREAADTSERFYKAPLIVTTSGGKDSSVCVALAEKAGIDFEVMHNHTTVDAPETVYFIRHEFKRLEEKGVKCTVNRGAWVSFPLVPWSAAERNGHNNERNEFESPAYGKLASRRRGGRLRHNGGARARLRL